VVPIELAGGTEGVSARSCGEVVGCLGHERHVEERLPWVPGDVVLVEDVDHREVADGHDEPAFRYRRAELHRVRVQLDVAAAELEGLAEEETGAIRGWRFGSSLLELEYLDRTPEPAKLRERPLSDGLGDEVDLASGPNLDAE